METNPTTIHPGDLLITKLEDVRRLLRTAIGMEKSFINSIESPLASSVALLASGCRITAFEQSLAWLADVNEV